MRRITVKAFVVGCLLLAAMPASAAERTELTILTPRDFQVVQRITPASGLLRLTGELSGALPPGEVSIEARVQRSPATEGSDEPAWLRVGGSVSGRELSGTVTVPAGGWWRLEVRVVQAGQEVARGSVSHVGVGEVFVVAGQSNSANHGEERQTPRTDRVVSFDGSIWRPAADPQPGASGQGGSFIPPFADAVVEQEDLPVGIIACGIGATSVREWLPRGATFPQPPTLEGRVSHLADGRWMSNGDAYAMLVARMKSVGRQGFRAVLWHQGESDANQRDAARTLSGELYRDFLTKIIRDSSHDIGWTPPWFVAQATYHGPHDRGSDEIRAAQEAVWRDGIALAGPDTDAFTGPLRDQGGQGVHFSGAGLRTHGAAWAEKVLLWLERQWTEPRRSGGGTEWTDYAQLPECHSLGWVSRNVAREQAGSWDGVLDEAKWGTPSPQQVLARNWDWRITDEQWREAVRQRGEGRREEVQFELWLPDDVPVVRGVVVMSGHGSGEPLFRRADLRSLARELHLAVFKFIGNPLQRGFWPRSLLCEQLTRFGMKCGHAELGNAPLFLYGHSNGTGFSVPFAAAAPERVWGWVSMRPGITFQVYQPAAAAVPGLVIFGENDHFLARPSREENLAVVPALRRRYAALWNIAVEPQTGHGPGEKTWPLVYSFLRHTFAARVPPAADPRERVVTLNPLAVESGVLGHNWDPARGGYQQLPVAAFADFTGDRATASWLVNAAYAADWQAFQHTGAVGH
jgi:hypothetical protein